MIHKAPTLGADVIIYDLEDSLPFNQKDSGRRLVAEAIQAPKGPGAALCAGSGPPVGQFGRMLAPFSDRDWTGWFLPKVASASDLQEMDAALGSLEYGLGNRTGNSEAGGHD